MCHIFLQIANSSLILTAPHHNMAACLSLDDLKSQLSFCLRENTALIYWNHSLMSFDFFLPSDKSTWREEMRNVRKYYRGGDVTSLSVGEPLGVNGTPLYPIEVMYREDRQCAALLVRGDTNDYHKTPYFFLSKAKRDETIVWLKRDPS